jgi:cation diffusion facilitator CzcD-associated flavoprotein CzcO
MSVSTSERYEVAVIGAGQAVLAIGHSLSLQRRRFVILEAVTEPNPKSNHNRISS